MPEMNEMWGDNQVSASKQEKARFFRDAKYGMFIHWGLFSQAASNWKGENFYGVPEWLMFAKKIPAAEYAELAKSFNPVKFDADALVRFAKKCGFRYLVITAKHHEGFAMFRSKHPFNIVTGSPYGRDPMEALSKACAKHGLGFGFYYSQFQDWHEINGWEKPQRKKCSFMQYFRKKCLPQITELLKNYGKLTLIWFDTPGEMTLEQSSEIVELVHKYQPDTLVNSRIGNGMGEYSTQGDQEVPRIRIAGLWESCDTTNDSWGFSSNDKNFITSKEILMRLIQTAARGGNYLLNVGPDSMGIIPEVCRNALLRAGEWLGKYGNDVLYGTEPSPWRTAQPWGDCTRRGNHAYFMLDHAIPGGKIFVWNFPEKILSVKRLSDGTPVEFVQDGKKVMITLPLLPLDPLLEPLDVLCEKHVSDLPDSASFGIDPYGPTLLPAEMAVLQGRCAFTHLQWMERFGEWKHKTCLHQWSENSTAGWKIAMAEAGPYRISVRYLNVPDKAKVWRFSCGKEFVDMWARPAAENPDGQARFELFHAGVLNLPAGEAILKIAPKGPEGEASSMQIAEIILEPFY